jgi:uncharacterized protein YPO0396
MHDHRHRSGNYFAGQFRLVRLQTVNWGTFEGYKDFPVDERGCLFTGPSGSGKSSLLDAHSLALFPTSPQFNASADLGSRGARQGTRTIADYVRGAWAESDDDFGQSQVRYLRSGGPTWTAVAVTYADGLGAVTTGVIVKWFTGTETDTASLKTMRQLHAGEFDLQELNQWAREGFDTKALKARHARGHYPQSDVAYVAELGKRVGLGDSRIVASLLSRAKAMKNVGDLNLFVRENMLDEPETFAAARSLEEVFTPLFTAYETAKRASDQEQVLRPVPPAFAAHVQAGQEIALVELLRGTPAETYLRAVHIGALHKAAAGLRTEAGRVRGTLDGLRHAEALAKRTSGSLHKQLDENDGGLRELEDALATARSEEILRRRARTLYAAQVDRLERPCPDSEAEFRALHGDLGSITARAKADIEARSAERGEAAQAAFTTKRDADAASKELRALEAAGSLIPHRHLERRAEIAHGAGVPIEQLPYAAELIDVAADQQRWRPAAERVLRSFGLRLLVPAQYRERVGDHIDQHDMRGVVEYTIVTAASSHQPKPRPDTLAAKLAVDTGTPVGAWLAGQLARQFDHACVETARDLAGHEKAVTVNGTVKLPGSTYRKDDRPEVARASSFILGTDPAAKRAALADELKELNALSEAARERADEFENLHERDRRFIDAAKQLLDYTIWTEVDQAGAAASIAQYELRIKEITSSDVDLQRLRAETELADKRWEDAIAERKKAQDAITEDELRAENLEEQAERHSKQAHTVDDPEHQRYLDQVLTSLPIEASPETMERLRIAFLKELGRLAGAAETEQRNAETILGNAITNFNQAWPDSTPDNSGDIAASAASFDALYAEIDQRKLPKAVDEFQKMISEDVLPSVYRLNNEIYEAGKQIRDRVQMVNSGLARVEFNPGTHLQIAYSPKPLTALAEFRAIVNDMEQRASERRGTAAQRALDQFTSIRMLMSRLGGGDGSAAGEHWRDSVLDVRKTFQFYGRETNTADDSTVHTYRATNAKSGGEQEKLVAFCLAAALSYNLAGPDSESQPRFAPLMLDEAFSKSDEAFAGQGLSAFDEFGFQLLIAAPIRMSGVLEPFIGQAYLVEKRLLPGGAHSHAASATFGELARRGAAEAEEG